MAKQPQKASFGERFKQIGTAFKYTAKRDKLFIPLVILAAGVPLAAILVYAILAKAWLWIPAGVLVGMLGVMIVLNLRTNHVVMKEAEGQPGAVVAILEMLRGDWRTTPAAQMTTQNDFVHRVLGRPGVILIAEGSPGRLRSLLSQEKKRLGRVIGETPIYDLTIGNDEGELPIRKLNSHLRKLPRNLTAGQVNALDTRLKALSARPQMPKGPIPKSMRPSRGGTFKATRGR